MSVKTKTAVVVSDGLTYKIPGQDKPVVAFGFAQTYLTQPATRGQEIELDADDYDRFLTLGAIAAPNSREASAAKTEPMRWGDPANAVQISGEDGTLPIDKLRAEARRLGLVDFDLEDDLDEPVSGQAPADLDFSDRKAVEKLTVAQLKSAAAERGVTVESADKKDDIVKKLVASSKPS